MGKMEILFNRNNNLKYKKVIYLFFFLVIFSCNRQKSTYPHPCIDESCSASYKVLYLGDTIQANNNGCFEVDYSGLNYFQVVGKLSPLHENYIVNDVPLINAKFDSDYWVVFDSLSFTIPMYSYLGWFNDQTLNTPIAIGQYTYTMTELFSLHPPLNVVGYQIPMHFCWDCPYAPTLVGVNSSYNYRPTCNVLLDDEMIGDTINIFIESIFNTEGGIWYHGYDAPVPGDTVKTNIKVVII